VSTVDCECCGKKWEEHPGIILTCQELQAYRKMCHALCIAELDGKLGASGLRAGIIANLIAMIREMNPELFKKEVEQPCGLA